MKQPAIVKLFVLMLTLFVLTAAASYAQNHPAAQQTAYVIPHIVYVGDPAVLIFPLRGGPETGSLVLPADSPYFPQDINIDFHRVVLERGASAGRLLIEFTAFAPGYHELPAVEIGGERFTGLSVTIASVIDSRSAPALSGPASSLAMPGTALMLYGTIAALVFALLLALWFVLKGRRYLQRWSQKFKRWQLFVSMRGMEKRLQRAMLRGENKRAILDVLSDKFRKFLTFFTGNNCRAMTAREFETMNENDSGFLGDFFRRCDKFRFSGEDIDQEDIFRLLADLRYYLEMAANVSAGGRV